MGGTIAIIRTNMARRSAPEPRNGARVRPLRRTEKISQVIARDIVRQIYDAQMQPGTRLSSEAQMLSEYDVGRASLREALRILEVSGLISMRPGPGPFSRSGNAHCGTGR